MTMSDTLQTLGILGSGQLGRMIAIAAAQLGIRARLFLLLTLREARQQMLLMLLSPLLMMIRRL